VGFLDLQHGLASDGWLLNDNLRITPLDGPAPVELPAPKRFTDPKAGFESAVYDALSAAQTIRTLLGATDETQPEDIRHGMSWQLLDATRMLRENPSCAALPSITRDSFAQLSAAASTVFLHTQEPPWLFPDRLDQSSVWITQLILRAWSQAALEMLEVARRHRAIEPGTTDNSPVDAGS
jgi:hypothetical protein